MNKPTLKSYIFLIFEPYLIFCKYKKIPRETLPSLKNKNVIVIGSGPSAANLSIPDNFIVICCNRSYTFLPNTKRIDIFCTTQFAVKESPEIKKEINVYPVKNKLCDSYQIFEKIHFYSPKNIISFGKKFDMHILIKKRFKLLSKLQRFYPSTGVNMICLALLLGAKNIYVAGIEAEDVVKYSGNSGYKNDPTKKINPHLSADKYILEYIKNNDLPVFVISEKSGLTMFLKQKALPR